MQDLPEACRFRRLSTSDRNVLFVWSGQRLPEFCARISSGHQRIDSARHPNMRSRAVMPVSTRHSLGLVHCLRTILKVLIDLCRLVLFLARPVSHWRPRICSSENTWRYSRSASGVDADPVRGTEVGRGGGCDPQPRYRALGPAGDGPSTLVVRSPLQNARYQNIFKQECLKSEKAIGFFTVPAASGWVGCRITIIGRPPEGKRVGYGQDDHHQPSSDCDEAGSAIPGLAAPLAPRLLTPLVRTVFMFVGAAIDKAVIP